MLELITRILPPAAILGLGLYGAATALWLQPLVEMRLAEKIYIPDCEAEIGRRRAGDNRSAGLRPAQQDAATRMVEELMEPYVPLMEMYGVPSVQAIIPEAPNMQTEALIPTATICGCAVAEAFDQIHVPMLLHVMSGRIYKPAALKTLSAYVGEATARCGAE